MCSMLLADFGADVVAIGRPGTDLAAVNVAQDLSRGKRSIVIDMRRDEGADLIRRLAARADVFVESFRPGTMERRGLGPEELRAANPRLVYTRISGWGQEGPYAARAGHDINYISLAGALGAVSSGRPMPPGAMLGDLASGSLFAAFGTLLALFEREQTGVGQVVDAAIVDGAALLTLPQLALLANGRWRGGADEMLNGHAPFYGTYECADGRWVSVGAVEPKFYANLLDLLGLDAALLDLQDDRTSWPSVRALVAARFGAHPREHWEALFAATDACGSPILSLDEVAQDPHLRARGTIVATAQGAEPAPAPRLSGHAQPVRSRPVQGGDAASVLATIGCSPRQVRELQAAGIVGEPGHAAHEDAHEDDVLAAAQPGRGERS
jgi:alpha-methylacyl-CoA racemase